MKAILSRYMSSGHRKVQGWLSPVGMNVIAELASIQKEIGVVGPVCEIGVHHGKLFILLHLLSEKSEKSVAWDLFERQEENVDRSGRGNSSIFMANLRRNGCDLERINMIAENSMNLTAETIEKACEGKPRLFSIDGGHTAEVAYNDLALACQTLSDGGLIILDDFFQEEWPGVAEGACRYMFEHKNALFPVVIAGNKYIFTNNGGAAKTYIDRLDRRHKGYYSKMSRAFGNDVLTLNPIKNIRMAVTQTQIWKNMRNKPFGLFLRKILGA